MCDFDNNTRPVWPYLRLPLHSLVLSSAITIPCWIGFRFFGHGDFSDENGWIENAQFGTLGCAFIVGVLAAIFSKKRVWICIAVTLSAVAAFGCARELPNSETLGYVSSITLTPRSKELIFGSSAIAAFVATLVMFVQQRQLLFRLWHPRFSWPAFLFLSCFAIAELSEEFSWVSFEEIVEIYAYTLLLFVNAWIFRLALQGGHLGDPIQSSTFR
ncbi:hypothetical protein [Novipirellula rosea]|uniref:Uncharacterized protein n=1 Tax=Novipirellula rosea TaxID=1031540 RepID=A0ABP8NIG2_9BACT